MTELLSQVEKYINSEETLKFVAGIKVLELNFVKEASSKRKYKEPKSDKSDKRPCYDGDESRESRPPLLKYNNYTPMNTTRINILMEIYDKPYMK